MDKRFRNLGIRGSGTWGYGVLELWDTGFWDLGERGSGT